MLHGGLVSITFRGLKPEEVVKLAAKSPLRGIEWGGDIHVPHGNLQQARKVRRMTEGGGLKTCSYGSYYRVGESERHGLPFQAVLESALELNAPTVRVWAGAKGSDAADEAHWSRVAEDSRRIAGMAAAEQVAVAFEFHCHTLTDTRQTAVRLLREAGHDNLYCYWQPPAGAGHQECIQGLRDIGERLSHIHAFHWEQRAGEIVRRPFSEGRVRWADYLKLAATAPADRFALLEFVEDDEPEKFLRDAGTLAELIGEANSEEQPVAGIK